MDTRPASGAIIQQLRGARFRRASHAPIRTSPGTGAHLPKKPNYDFEKRKKEADRKKKKDQKREDRLQRNRDTAGENRDGESPDSEGEEPQADGSGGTP